MSNVKNFKQLAMETTECIMIPCVYDCGSTLAAELSGAQAILLSGGELGESLGVLESMLSVDDIVNAVERICTFSSIPCIVDVGAGYDDPINSYYTSLRIIKAGAKALLVGNERGETREEYMIKLKAALKACHGSDCIVVARKNGPLETDKDLEECIDTLNEAVSLGAEATMACGLCHSARPKELARIIGERVDGWKIYPDQNSVDGKPDVINDEIFEFGFKMISYHYMMKVALDAMWRYGLKNMKNKDNTASNDLSFPNGLTGHSALGVFPMQRFLNLEAEFTGIPQKLRIPGSKAGRENG